MFTRGEDVSTLAVIGGVLPSITEPSSITDSDSGVHV